MQPLQLPQLKDHKQHRNMHAIQLLDSYGNIDCTTVFYIIYSLVYYCLHLIIRIVSGIQGPEN